MRKEAENWIKQAQRDLQNAEKNLEISAYEVSVFLANQAVEKYLKGVWIHLKKEEPLKTHSLVELGKGLNVPEDILSSLKRITSDYLITRYPDAANGLPYEIFDKNIAKERIKIAENVIKWLNGKIKE